MIALPNEPFNTMMLPAPYSPPPPHLVQLCAPLIAKPLPLPLNAASEPLTPSNSGKSEQSDSIANKAFVKSLNGWTVPGEYTTSKQHLASALEVLFS